MRSWVFIFLASAGVGLLMLSAACTCDPVYPHEVGENCSDQGDKSCDDTSSLDILVCVEHLRWELETACDDFGMSCDESDGDPICVDAPCSPEQTRCTTDYAQVIVCNDAGEWTHMSACEEGEVCVVEDEAARCAPPSCDEGQTRCTDDRTQVETCNADSQWILSATCVEGEVCEVVTLDARCVEALFSCTAETELNQRCDPEDPLWVQECRNLGTEGAPVYEWVDVTDCSTMSPDYICQQVGDNAPFCFPPA